MKLPIQTPKLARNLFQSAGGTQKVPPPPSGDGDAKVSAKPAISPEKRYKLIAEAAYHRAAKRKFAAGGELKDWLEAETEIKQRFGQ
jgi:hypothetical protein